MELALLIVLGLAGEPGLARLPAFVPPASARVIESDVMKRIRLGQRAHIMPLARAVADGRDTEEGDPREPERPFSVMICRTRGGYRRLPHADCSGGVPWHGLRAVVATDERGEPELRRVYLWTVFRDERGRRVSQSMPPFQLRPNRDVVYESDAQKTPEAQDLLQEQLRYWMNVSPASIGLRYK